jgi:hypothetical protein
MSERRPTRRQFNNKVAILAATPVLGAAAGAEAAPPPAQPGGADAAAALTDVVRQRHGKHLTKEQLDRVRERIESQQRTAAFLRRTALTNADEPDFVFVAELP